MENNTQRLEARVHGRVQGVNFRATTIDRAGSLGLGGWVRNNHDGTVGVVAEGPRAQLEDLLSFLNGGPPAARVEKVEANWSAATGEFEGFGVRYHAAG